MPAWETCEIVIETVRGGGFFGGSRLRWVARKITTSGVEVIATSDEFKMGPSDDENAKATHNKLVAHLAYEGWEPAADAGGQVTLMKRRIGEQSAQATTSADLLQQLANLRSAGILTEQEFRAKKAEILKRI